MIVALPVVVLAGGLVLTAMAGERVRAFNRQEHEQIKSGLLRDVAAAITANITVPDLLPTAVAPRAANTVNRGNAATACS